MTQLQMTLSEVADLAHVRRPVPSVWRRRSEHSDLPFPDAIATTAGQERFDADEVVGWLEATGRGRNPTAREDAAAYALPAGLDLREDRAVLDGLTALLALRVASGVDLADLDPREIYGIARAVDPDDTYLVREIDDLGDRLAVLADLADRRADAAFSSSVAFDQLSRRRTASIAAEDAFAPEALRLLTGITDALSRTCGAPTATYVDPLGTGGAVIASALLDGPDGARTVCSPLTDSPTARRFRRRLRVHDVHHESRAHGLAGLGPAVAVLQLPSPGDATPTDEAMLEVVDDLALEMTDDQRLVVVGPARLLVDRLGDRSLDARRSQVLRLGRLRAAVRLPSGLVLNRFRQALGLWVLGPDLSGHAPDERRIATVDLTDDPLTDLTLAQLVDDVVAATSEPTLARAHSYAHARLTTVATLLAGAGSLVGPTRTSNTEQVPADLAVRIEQLRGKALGDAVLVPGTGRRTAALTVGDALAAKAVRLVPGNRDGFDLHGAGTVDVIGVPELTGERQVGDRRVDRLAFLAGWAANRVTEPGDVVFCTSPRPSAMVDIEGGRAVHYPARVLRIDPLGGEDISPHVLARDIARQPAHARAWRSWPVRRVAASQTPQVARAYAGVAAERAALTARLAELNALTDVLDDALTSHALVIDRKDH